MRPCDLQRRSCGAGDPSGLRPVPSLDALPIPLAIPRVSGFPLPRFPPLVLLLPPSVPRRFTHHAVRVVQSARDWQGEAAGGGAHGAALALGLGRGGGDLMPEGHAKWGKPGLVCDLLGGMTWDDLGRNECLSQRGQDARHPPTWLELELNLRSHDLPPREKTVMAGSWPQVNQGGGEGGYSRKAKQGRRRGW